MPEERDSNKRAAQMRERFQRGKQMRREDAWPE